MTWSRDAHSRGPWSAGSTTEQIIPGQQTLPPPIPGGTTTFTYAGWTGLAWAYRGWAGGGAQAIYPGGGISLYPDPANGVMKISAWWPYASALQLMRVGPDGIRRPVRGGYPINVTTATRRNAVQNPSLETGTNGFVPADGSPTLTRVTTPTVTAPRGSYALRCTIASAGSCGVTVPTDLTGNAPVTVAFDMRLSARATAVRVTIAWTDSLGGALGTTTLNLTSDQINNSVSQFARQVVTSTPPAAAVTPTLKIIADGMPSAGTMDLDGLTFEAATTTGGAFFDGTVPGGTWVGTADLSASLLAQIVTVDDGECPFDVSVSYVLINPAIAGGSMTSVAANLPSTRRAWLTHPSTPGAPFQVDLRETPALEYPMAQGTFRPIGSKYAVVVSELERQSAAGEVKINALTLADRTQLKDTFNDGSPVLLRTPGNFTFTDMWIGLNGPLTVDPEGRGGWQEGWLLSAPFVETDAPSALVP